MEVRDEQADVVALDRDAEDDPEVLRALGDEPHELLREDLLQQVTLLDFDAEAQRVDGRLDQAVLVLGPRDENRRKHQLLVVPKG